MSLGTQRVPQPSAGARRRVAVGHLNLIVKVKILQSKKQKNYWLCKERNPNLIVQIVFYAMLIVYFYLLSLFVSVVYKSSASHSHRLLVIKAADEVWMLALIHPTEGQFRFSKTKNEVN